MALRIREGGSPIVCAAMHPELPGDTYIPDSLHYRLSAELGVLVAEPMEKHKLDGLWWWRDEVPPDRTPELRGDWPGEVCKRCCRRNVIGFNLPDEVWQAVVRDRWNVLCPTCFDEEAQLAGVRYSFSDIYPVSWSEWPGRSQ